MDVERKTISVSGHHEWRESLSAPDSRFDEIDDDMIEVPWPELNPPSRRSDSELNRVLSILDNLPTGKDEP